MYLAPRILQACVNLGAPSVANAPPTVESQLDAPTQPSSDYAPTESGGMTGQGDAKKMRR